jgi:hypothetical protein
MVGNLIMLILLANGVGLAGGLRGNVPDCARQ